MGNDEVAATRGVGTQLPDAFFTSCPTVSLLIPSRLGRGALLPEMGRLPALSPTLRVEVMEEGVCVRGLSSCGLPRTQSATQIEEGGMEQLCR